MTSQSSTASSTWAPNFPPFVHFKDNGGTHQIKVRQHHKKFYFADGLTEFRRDLQIYESTTIDFYACDQNWIFNLHFTPPLEQQTCGRPRLSTRKYVWTVEATQSMLGAPYPLALPPCVVPYVDACVQHMIILRKYVPPLQWNVTIIDPGIGEKSIVRP
ncbi:hypothetical protein GLYMA_15G196701v4 [Glycine max]|uniref:uncharacterized protein n=1 Tax=Glycine max TaxID=3847 RepID=UPI0003DE74C9|nr:uncharacterized protein LOC102665111 [Glycine max]KAG4381669.1 hypothetical protein GLYMA_15G196701v4 [Glycine max]